MSEQKLREALERQAILTHNKRTYCRLCEWWDIHAPDCVFTLLAASPATVAGAGFVDWWAERGCGDKEMKAIARTGYQAGQAALLTGLRGLWDEWRASHKEGWHDSECCVNELLDALDTLVRTVEGE